MSQTITVTLPDGYDPQNVLDFVTGDTRMWAMSQVQKEKAAETEAAVSTLTSDVVVKDEAGEEIVAAPIEEVIPEAPVEEVVETVSGVPAE